MPNKHTHRPGDIVKNITKIAAGLIACIGLSSCVSLRAPSKEAHYDVQSQQSRQQALNDITCWSVRGAFSITTATDSQIANYTWVLNDQTHFMINIASTLNVYQLQITRDGDTTTLIKDQQRQLQAHAPEDLMQQALGYSLPISNLYYWIRGVAAPGKQQTHYDRYGHLKELMQDGWHITFSNYTHRGTVDLPGLIQLNRRGMAIRLVIQHWDPQCPTQKRADQ